MVTLVHISVQEFWPLPAAAHISSRGLNLIMRPATPLKHTLKCCFFLSKCSLKLLLFEPSSIPSSVTKCCQCCSKAHNFGEKGIQLTAKTTIMFPSHSQECVGHSENFTSRSNQPGVRWTVRNTRHFLYHAFQIVEYDIVLSC